MPAQAPKLRQYEGIWIKIKNEGKATLRVRPAYAATVRKAVKKERSGDRVWKLTHEYDHFYLVIKYDETTELMSFVLKQSLGIE